MTCDHCEQEAVLQWPDSRLCLDCAAGEEWGLLVHRLAQANVAAAFELGRAEAHQQRLRMAFLHNLPRWTGRVRGGA